jgi:glycosyltransferase involved in cell wall biosynthesis
MKILHVIANLAPRYGGPSKACLEMSQAITELGHKVTIYSTNQNGPAVLDMPTDIAVNRNGVEIRYFPIQYPRFWGTSLPLANALREKIKVFDIVHIHSLYLFHSMISGYYCRKFNIPYLIRPHGTLDPFIYKRHRYRKFIIESLFENKNIKNAAAIHFTSEKEKALAASYIFKTPSIVIPNGLNVIDYKSLPVLGMFRSCYPETLGKKIILFFGRINFKKGLDILVRSFAKIAKARDDVHLVITGPDNEGFGDKVRGWLKEQGILDRATFTGMLLDKEKLSVLRDADIFVLPSYSENFGISVIEAMACGIPVVISDKVNIWREVVLNGAGKVAACDSDRFADMISYLLDNPEEARLMGKNGKTLAIERFQWSSVALSLENAYRSIIFGKCGR